MTTERKQLLVELRKRAQQARAKKAAATAQSTTPVKPKAPLLLNYRQMMEDYERLSKGSGGNFLRASALPPGQTKMRVVMPPDIDAFYAHRVVVWIPDTSGNSDSKAVCFTSPTSTGSEEYCPAVVLAKALKVHAKTLSAKAAKSALKLSDQLWPRQEIISNVFVLNAQTSKWEHKLFTYGVSIFKGLVEGQAAEVDQDDLDGDSVLRERNFADPKYGRVVVINKTGTGMSTKYSVSLTTKARPITPEELKQCKALGELCTPDALEVIEDKLCDLFGATDFQHLLGNLDDYAMPMSADDDPPQAQRNQPQRRKAPAVPADPDDYEEEIPEDASDADSAIPTCVGFYGKPHKGFVCDGCPVETECEEICALPE